MTADDGAELSSRDLSRKGVSQATFELQWLMFEAFLCRESVELESGQRARRKEAVGPKMEREVPLQEDGEARIGEAEKSSSSSLH